MYVHGSILRHNPASSVAEVAGLKRQNVNVLRDYLSQRDVIAIGYSGWNDALMAALYQARSSGRNLYWCDILHEPPRWVGRLLAQWGERGAYVNLGKGGADAFMAELYRGLIPRERMRDPLEHDRRWRALIFRT